MTQRYSQGQGVNVNDVQWVRVSKMTLAAILGSTPRSGGNCECHLRGVKTKLTWQQGPPQPDNYDVNGDDADNDTDQEVITHLFVNIHSEEWLRARFDLQFHPSYSCKPSTKKIHFFLPPFFFFFPHHRQLLFQWPHRHLCWNFIMQISCRISEMLHSY